MTTELIRGKIYKIVDNTSDRIYIGSTTKELDQRLQGHYNDFLKFNRGKYHYVSSFAIICKGDYKIELVEEVVCSSKQELHKIEAYFIKQSPHAVNCNMPGRSKKQYYQDNKQVTCECGTKYKNKDKDTHMKSDQHIEYVNAVWEEYA